MTSLPPLSIDDFAEFFHALHNRSPFPWQERLARQVTETGWPDILDLPTGTGKTAALDVGVFALALAAGQKVRTAPLRIVYVVDRRTIVDQAYVRAKTIQGKLARAENGVLRRIRDHLERYTGGGIPLRTALLRGGIARDDWWSRTPDQPLIAVSTVDQVGSRLLFRGYGVSSLMAPVQAALLGCDVLYLLDEVHLSQPFRETLTSIAGRYRTWAERPLPSPFVVVEMSATPGEARAGAFHLDEADRANPTLSERLRSSKPVSLAPANARGFLKEIQKNVPAMLERPGATVAVIVNRVRSARDLHGQLRAATTGSLATVHLLTGRMRPFDRDAIEQDLLQRVRAGRTRSAADQPVIVVATQSIEAGADFDFDGLITECASLDALRQRFGRLDRLGELAGSARGVIVSRTDALKDDPVYGDAIGKTWDWLQTRATEQIVDFGIDALEVPSDANEQGLLAPRSHAPVLLPSHLDAWVQTAPLPEPEPDVALWLHGPERGLADIQIVWRVDLTEDLLNLAAGDENDGACKALAVARGMIEALPPVSAEAMQVPFVAAKRWLEGRSEPESFDVEGARNIDEEESETQPERLPRAALVWQGQHSLAIKAKSLRRDQLRPGQTIVVPASYGGIAYGNWAPASLAPVEDVAELAALRQGRRPTLRLHESVVQGLLGPGVHAPEPPSLDSEVVNDRDDIVRPWLANLTRQITNPAVRALIDGLVDTGSSLRVDRLPMSADDLAAEYFVVVGRRSARVDEEAKVDGLATVDDSGSSFTGVEVTLSDHLCGVAELASGFAERTGLSAELIADMKLAAEWHDGGKADPRFQRWLHGGSEFKALVQTAPLAKSQVRLSGPAATRLARERARYPAGARHELMSVALMASAGAVLASRAADWELVQHLVASHHGHCRPFAPWVQDLDPVNVSFTRDGIACHGTSNHDLAGYHSGVADIFWRVVRRYGWWGLAWLETVLRLADHRQSEREVIPGRTPHA